MRWLLGRINAPRAPVFVAILVLIGALRAAHYRSARAVARPRDFAFDSYQRIEPRTYNPETAGTHRRHRRGGARRNTASGRGRARSWRRLVDKLTEKGAVVVAFDAVFAEPDRSSISRMVRDLVAFTDPETVQKLAAAVQDNDKVLADAMAQSRRRHGLRLRPQGQRESRRARSTAWPSPATSPCQFLPQQGGTVKSIDILEAAAKGNGSVNTDVDSVVIRRVPMLFRVAGQEGLFSGAFRSRRCGWRRRRPPI